MKHATKAALKSSIPMVIAIVLAVYVFWALILYGVAQ